MVERSGEPAAQSTKDNVAQPGENVKKYSLKQRDSDYLAAVNSGDMETAQRMVDEAAKAAGYTRRAFHQTSAKNITVFDLSIGTNGGTDSGDGKRGGRRPGRGRSAWKVSVAICADGGVYWGHG